MGTLGTWIVGAVLVAILAMIVRKIYKDRKKGVGCGCGCESCNACPSKLTKQNIVN